jgi:hypothetical protein
MSETLSKAERTAKAIECVVHEFCGIQVRVRKDNGHMCATDACTAGGKEWNSYIRYGKAQRYAEAVSKNLGVSYDKLIVSNEGRTANRGTWVHPYIAIHLVQWISPEFALQATKWIIDYLTGDLKFVLKALRNHGPLQTPEEVQDIGSFRAYIYDLIEQAKKDKVIIEEQKNTIKELHRKMDEMAKRQEEMIAKNDKIINQNIELKDELKEVHATATETLREAQDANDRLEDVAQVMVEIAPYHVHIPADGNKQDVMIISRTEDRSAVPYQYYISCVQKDGAEKARERVQRRFPNCQEIRYIEYVPNATQMRRALADYLGKDRAKLISTRLRIKVPMTEEHFLRIVEEVRVRYIAEAERVAAEAAEAAGAAEAAEMTEE